jgi:hypothetical protein
MDKITTTDHPTLPFQDCAQLDEVTRAFSVLIEWMERLQSIPNPPDKITHTTIIILRHDLEEFSTHYLPNP